MNYRHKENFGVYIINMVYGLREELKIGCMDMLPISYGMLLDPTTHIWKYGGSSWYNKCQSYKKEIE